eukprot:3574297-Heterocapsa_arctica.AAC.1
MIASEVTRTGELRSVVEARVLVDHRPAPTLSPGNPVLCPMSIMLLSSLGRSKSHEKQIPRSLLSSI